MVGPINSKINLLSGEKQQYMEQARKDVATRRAMHNAQLQAYDQEIKPLKRQALIASLKQNFSEIGQKVGKMGPV